MIVEAVQDTIKLLRLILPILFFGLLLSNLVYSSPHFNKLINTFSNLMNRAKLKSGAAIASFLVHPVMAFSMLSEMRRRGVIDNREVVIASLVGIFPRAVRLVVLYVAPVVIPVLGFWGLLYVILVLSTRTAVAALGIVIAKKTLDGGTVRIYAPRNGSLKEVVFRFLRVSAVLSVSIFVTMLAFRAGLLNYLEGFSQTLSALGLPPSAFLIVAAGIPSMLAGIATASSFYTTGVIAGLDAIIALFIASAFHSIVEMLRNTMPITVSLFGKSLGFKAGIVVAFARIAANFAAVFILYIIKLWQ